MKLFGIVLVKNEADVLRYALEKNSRWFDQLFVLDNGSSDRSVEIANEVASSNSRVVVCPPCHQPFRDGLRSLAFNQYRNRSEKGDWWCRLDADEVYEVDPKPYLQKVKSCHHVVWSQHLNFYFSQEELPSLEDRIVGDEIPDFDETLRPKGYLCNFTEPRFFRYRKALSWGEDMSWPKNVGVTSPLTIPVHHYQYRSPQQIDLRLQTRKEAASTGWSNFGKDVEAESWRDKIGKNKELIPYSSDEDVEPKMHPLDVGLKRSLKLVLHQVGLLP